TVVGSAAYRSAIEAVEKRGADDATLLELTAERDDPWLETRIREVLRGGTLFTCDFAVTKSSFTPIDYRRYRVEPPVYVPGVSGFHKTSSHFLDLSQESPQGREIYHNMLRWFGRSARKYPVFLYELVNEVSYISPTPANIRAFHVQMRKKYGTIKQANAAWGAKFDAFTAVIPPINIDSSGIYNSKSGVIPHGDALSVPLWIDWLRFMETRAVEVFRDLAATQRKVDPRARTTFQTPYWTGTHAQFPHALTGVQDVYGAEHFLTLYRQKAGAEVWGEVRQMLAPQLANDLVRAASSSMPSINLEARVVGYPHDDKDPRDNYIIGPAGIRTFLWHQAVHGVSGSVVSYFYDNEVSEGGGSVWDPRWMSPEAVKELPRVKNAILSVADLVLPRPRIRGAIGLVYPRETARVLRPEKDDVYRQFLPEVLDYYAAATFTRAPVDALIGQDILDGKHRQLPMLVLAHCGRVLPDVLEELERYVQRGGVLVVSPDSLLVDDRFGEKLDASKLLGGAVGGEVFQEEAVRFRMPEVPSGKTIGLRATSAAGYDFARPVYGYAFKPSSAKPLGQTAGGAAALTANAVGQGTVYYLAREFEPAVRSALLRWIAARHGLKAEVDVAFTDGIAGDYVETHLFGGRGRRVVYALNFGGGPRKALLRPATGLPAEGARATVRDLHTGLYLGPGESVGRVAWERADLERGIAVELPMHDPVVLLVEDAALEPVPLRQLTAEQERTLRWLYRPSPKAAKRVLIDGVYVAEGRVHKWRMPTAVKLLEDNGYQVNSLCAPLRTPLMRGIDGLQAEALASYDVFVLSGTHGKTEWEDKDIRKVADYVQDGGGLLVCLIR
ncbi:beta-galactosidase trimerization domain-containing protein, partial [bacterium]|nr:beta-galactosidase trimerization domain-containing protein [bacterium]